MNRRVQRRRKRARGFSLMEALVALAIAAVTMSGFYGAVSTGLQLRSSADAQAEAVLLAASVLDRVGIDIPLQVGLQLEGTASAGRWQLVISDRAPRDMGAVPSGDGRLAFVSVSVDGPREVVLRSIRYVQAPL